MSSGTSSRSSPGFRLLRPSSARWRPWLRRLRFRFWLRPGTTTAAAEGAAAPLVVVAAAERRSFVVVGSAVDGFLGIAIANANAIALSAASAAAAASAVVVSEDRLTSVLPMPLLAVLLPLLSVLLLLLFLFS